VTAFISGSIFSKINLAQIRISINFGYTEQIIVVSAISGNRITDKNSNYSFSKISGVSGKSITEYGADVEKLYE